MAIVNNIPHTTYTVDEDPFDGVTLTVTCDDGYTFDGAPTIDYNDNVFGDEYTGVELAVNDANNIATITDGEIDADTIVIKGNVSGGAEPTPTPTEPNVVNKITDAKVSHTVEETTVNITVSYSVPNYVLTSFACNYTDKDGVEHTEDITTNVIIDDANNFVCRGGVSVTDVDYSHDIVISGTPVLATDIQYSLSGCKSNITRVYALFGETLDVTLTADDGNEFSDAEKVYIEPQGYFVSDKVLLTISEDKKTATGSYTVEEDAQGVVIFGETSQVAPTPTSKYGMVNAYVINEDNLEDLAKGRFVTTGSDTNDIADYINRIKRFYFDIDRGSTTNIKCGNYVIETECHNLKDDVKTLSFGSVEIPNYTNSAADYQTDVNLFIPFKGLVSLPSDIIGKTVELTLSVNLLSATGVYTLTCDDVIVWCDDVSPSSDIIYRTALQEDKVIGGGNFDSLYLYGLKPYVVVNQQTVLNDGAEHGTSKIATIEDLTGYNKVTNVHFSNTENMLQQDIDEVMATLRSGFYL